ncbi:GNAT family N-acetyltransferase [Actinotalea sp. M2MS4P-6]|uniref:GNAT family N-acetyltransferase n=1 Tax=Actinotalea sp. M2MS4P-6 TaxID=2983762 RepID=UPI0021E41620|nr:GNAT family N-acetyltransferase [Actinotalea sp. M2MS4P-6]MCV2392962.1 GNAT family N-acetyltransferase [Actinotalea sp. M2MS4P-6]
MTASIPGARVRPTTPADLDDLASLWNDGAVMTYVGFPDGLGVDKDAMAAWWRALTSNPDRQHRVIEHDELGFCGEAYYATGDGPVAVVDIKLAPGARGRGLGTLGLSSVLDELADGGRAERAKVDPHRDNRAALRLYRRLGFRSAPWPPGEGDPDHVYLGVDLATRPWHASPPAC